MDAFVEGEEFAAKGFEEFLARAVLQVGVVF
jgi:hypothetical protein